MDILSYSITILSILGIFIIVDKVLNTKDFIEKIILSASSYIAINTFISLILLILSIYSYKSSVFVTISVVLIVLFYKYVKQFKKFQLIDIKGLKISNGSILLIVFILFLLPIVWGRYEYIEMTGDAGVYSTSALHYIEEGDLYSTISIRNKMSQDIKRIFNEENFLEYDENRNKGHYLPGTYLSSDDTSEYYYQGYPLWPIVLANWGSLFGVKNMHYVMVIIYILLVYITYYTSKNLGIKTTYSLAFTILLATSPITIHFSKYPTAELLLLFFGMLSLYFITNSTKLSYGVAGFIVTLFCLTHVSSFLYIPLLILAIPFIYFCNMKDMFIFLIISFLGFLVSIPYGTLVCKQYMFNIYNGTFGILTNGNGELSIKLGFFATILMGMIGICLSTYGFIVLKQKHMQGE